MRYFIFLLVLTTAIFGWLSLQSSRQQRRLNQQLEQLTGVLSVENDLAKHNAQNTIRGIETAAAKNQNQPTELALLHRVQGLQTCVNQLVDMLRTCGDQLRRTTGNLSELLPFQHFGSPIKLTLSQGTPHRQALERQLATYADTLRRLSPTEANAAALRVPAFEEDTPVVEALADLCQLESEVLALQTKVLHRIAKSIGKKEWQLHLLATATAESNVVAPGDTYRAKLGLVSYYPTSELAMHMACNGQPVPTDADGIGIVRFRAPTRLGPATWKGTIRFNHAAVQQRPTAYCVPTSP
jgi:hypothetical protein